MAISPPSDLVLDVLRAADPASVQEAQAKLKSNRASFEATSLADAGNGFGTAVGILNRDSSGATAGSAATTGVGGGKAIPETYRKFEAMVLQNFVKSMLPADSEEIYGKGTAGEIWRGMMAEQIGEVIAKGGGIGIAASLAKDNDKKDATNDIAVIDPNAQRVSTAMLQEMQRTAFAELMPGEENNKKTS